MPKRAIASEDRYDRNLEGVFIAANVREVEFIQRLFDDQGSGTALHDSIYAPRVTPVPPL